MEREQTIEEELEEQIEELRNLVARCRADGDDEFEINEHLDMFELNWDSRLNLEERAEIRVSKKAVESAVWEVVDHERFRAYVLYYPLLSGLDHESRSRFVNHYADPSQSKEYRAELATSVSEAVTEDIRERFSDLRYNLSELRLDIEYGCEPSHKMILSSQIEKERLNVRLHRPTQDIIGLLNSEIKKQRGYDHDL